MTPPSAEAVTPTTEDPAPKSVITETVENTIVVPAKEVETNGEQKQTEKKVEQNLEKSAEKSDEVPLEKSDEVPLEKSDEVPLEKSVEVPSEEVSKTDVGDQFVRAELPDFNPNPHSTPAATEPEQRLEP